MASRAMAGAGWRVSAFCAAGVAWINAAKLLPTNQHYEPAWWKVVAFTILFAWFSYRSDSRG